MPLAGNRLFTPRDDAVSLSPRGFCQYWPLRLPTQVRSAGKKFPMLVQLANEDRPLYHLKQYHLIMLFMRIRLLSSFFSQAVSLLTFFVPSSLHLF